jgi:hypothetical protein
MNKTRGDTKMKTAHQLTAQIDLCNERKDTDGRRVVLIQARLQAVSVDGELLGFADGSTLRVIDGGELLIPYVGQPDHRPEPTRSVQVLSNPRR